MALSQIKWALEVTVESDIPSYWQGACRPAKLKGKIGSGKQESNLMSLGYEPNE
jgi:hypothetical protein